MKVMERQENDEEIGQRQLSRPRSFSDDRPAGALTTPLKPLPTSPNGTLLRFSDNQWRPYDQANNSNNNNKSPKPSSGTFLNSNEQRPLLERRRQQQQQPPEPHGTPMTPSRNQKGGGGSSNNTNTNHPGNFVLYLIYALVNVIIAVPGLYGYAAVIFNHPVFQPHRNALAKLVLFSSLVHQLGFLLFSGLGDFAIGTVQDAGLIFLSSMANTIANRMLSDGNSEQAIVATTIVLLSSGTALLGAVLVVIGLFKWANAVSYLPMPVIGGYLAFIGYFCIQAGVALCISTPLISFMDWKYLFQGDNLILATPGLLAALVLVLVSRLVRNNAILPLCMVLIPSLFYVVLLIGQWDLDTARDNGWVGEVAPPTPVSDVLGMVNFSLVRWDLVGEILWTWVGMVFVVSFASCLDVAAISMDMGEALDTNKELATVGICNFMSGLSLGFTGSYIFSQTIFTYRTGVHSRWIGVFIMITYLCFVGSPMNLLEVSPLFFLGSTLIFIGYDLVYEWLYEIRQRVLWAEYGIIWLTFVAIQIVGVDAGILVGVLVAIVEHVVANAQSTSVHQVRKQSRAIWNPEEYRFLQETAYNIQSPRIVTIEVVGPVFFASSLSTLDRLRQEVALSGDDNNSLNAAAQILSSPHTSSFLLTMGDKRPSFFRQAANSTPMFPSRPPQFCVLDLTQMSNMDVSAARTCFLQLSKMCKKRGMTVCASGATPKIAWMLRSHDAAYAVEEEERVKARIQSMELARSGSAESLADKMLLFLTSHEALEFCEASLIHQFQVNKPRGVAFNVVESTANDENNNSSSSSKDNDQLLSSVLARFLSASPEETAVLQRFDTERYHDTLDYRVAEKIVTKQSRPESFYIVLKGAVASGVGREQAVYRHRQQIVTGAGLVKSTTVNTSQSDLSTLLDAFPEDSSPVLATMWPVGGVFGYSDLLLDRPRTFGAFAAQDNTRVARITRSNMNLLQQEDSELNALLHRVLLRASVLDLANCTCDDV